jgi:protein-S-isoprenylcysteine O-methyltransferase Ste14
LSSSAGPLTGMAGAAAALLVVALLRDWQVELYLKTLAVIAAAGLAMVVVDLQIYRVNFNSTTGLAAAPARPFDLRRTAQKLVGFFLTIGAIGALYWVFPLYSEPFYEPFLQACFYCLPALVVLAPLYIGYVDQLQDDPHDAYVDLALLVAGKRPADWSALAVHARGWTVKAFFLPVMFVFANNSLSKLLAHGLPDSFEQMFSLAIDLFYLIDVLLAAAAYTLTLRLLDSHIRSTDPTLAGWVACLCCYPPFWATLGSNYLAYDQDNLFWGHVLHRFPVLYMVWGSAILALVAVYVWATMAFGLRFSNLTHRGIITGGPYRWVKHPAYLCKNVSYWLISVPFLPGTDWLVAAKSCLLLAGVNIVYWLRAVTEERHLAADPAYRDYQAFIASDGLWARLRTATRRKRP